MLLGRPAAHAMLWLQRVVPMPLPAHLPQHRPGGRQGQRLCALRLCVRQVRRPAIYSIYSIICAAPLRAACTSALHRSPLSPRLLLHPSASRAAGRAARGGRATSRCLTCSTWCTSCGATMCPCPPPWSSTCCASLSRRSSSAACCPCCPASLVTTCSQVGGCMVGAWLCFQAGSLRQSCGGSPHLPTPAALAAQRGFEAAADVAVVGPRLKVLDADLAFEVRGRLGRSWRLWGLLCGTGAWRAVAVCRRVCLRPVLCPPAGARPRAQRQGGAQAAAKV